MPRDTAISPFIVDVRRRVLDMYFAFGCPGVSYFDANVIHRLQSRFDLIRPFNKHYRARIAEIVEAYHFKLVNRIQPIRIYVVNIELACILVDDDECRACDRSAVLSAAPAAMPLIKCVLPLPNWPQTAMISPPFNCCPILRPSSIVCSGDSDVMFISIVSLSISVPTSRWRGYYLPS